MSLFDPTTAPELLLPTENDDDVDLSQTNLAIVAIIVITAISLSSVLGFALFAIWHRMKKRREQQEAVIRLVEFARYGNGNAQTQMPRQEGGVVHGV
ncbi:hypothetical protein BDW02DRAFT_565973 [Decorospora gaudefroyi]|uniref:Uncharacterized protein n=1 Tax=Decorospora gaudefroyi TaxID=184978 RepID=A0A6A5KSQ8_9PLEO|nr:hypothetical protein BDW02DRAFT_565973 [Decorospora gaudefroyi]